MISRSCKRGYCGACKDVKNCEHACHILDKEIMEKELAS